MNNPSAPLDGILACYLALQLLRVSSFASLAKHLSFALCSRLGEIVALKSVLSLSPIVMVPTEHCMRNAHLSQEKKKKKEDEEKRGKGRVEEM